MVAMKASGAEKRRRAAIAFTACRCLGDELAVVSTSVDGGVIGTPSDRCEGAGEVKRRRCLA
eukprot:scaffold72449_cov30-Tisochrysis_lutea.AAC.6